MERTTEQVMESHLKYRKSGEVEKDITEDISEDVLILSNHGNFHGHNGVLESSKILKKLLPDATYDYKLTLIEKNFALLIWTGESDKAIVKHGADSFVIEDGKIIFQSIYYIVEEKEANQ